jgi:hypothetical protein
MQQAASTKSPLLQAATKSILMPSVRLLPMAFCLTAPGGNAILYPEKAKEHTHDLYHLSGKSKAHIDFSAAEKAV